MVVGLCRSCSSLCSMCVVELGARDGVKIVRLKRLASALRIECDRTRGSALIFTHLDAHLHAEPHSKCLISYDRMYFMRLFTRLFTRTMQ